LSLVSLTPIISIPTPARHSIRTDFPFNEQFQILYRYYFQMFTYTEIPSVNIIFHIYCLTMFSNCLNVCAISIYGFYNFVYVLFKNEKYFNFFQLLVHQNRRRINDYFSYGNYRIFFFSVDLQRGSLLQPQINWKKVPQRLPNKKNRPTCTFEIQTKN
jgi:hypothetical protein